MRCILRKYMTTTKSPCVKYPVRLMSKVISFSGAPTKQYKHEMPMTLPPQFIVNMCFAILRSFDLSYKYVYHFSPMANKV